MGSIKAHLRYFGITETDVAALRKAKSVIEKHADEFIDRFYGHLQEFEETRAFVTDPAVLRRLLDAQRRYLFSLFDANFNNDYYIQRCRIGETHFRIGLDFKWYVGAYNLYFGFFAPVFETHWVLDADLRHRVQSAYRKVLLMDMSIVLEAFHKLDKQALESSKNEVLQQEKLATVGLLVSGLAHEIGNPLASIQAICDSQLRKVNEPSIAERFARIRTQVVRIVHIVGQLINYARPAPAVWSQVDIHEVIKGSMEIAILSRREKNAVVHFELDPDMPRIDALSEQLSQVFLNLFINALDAVSEQGGELHISTAHGHETIIIQVRDNGGGISKEHLTGIFEPFFTTKDVGKGTGLGLHVSLSIVQRHRGRIQCASVVNQGTVFTITLPRTQQSELGEPV